MGRIKLSDMIVGLRQELEEAQAKAAKENLKFKFNLKVKQNSITLKRLAVWFLLN